MRAYGTQQGLPGQIIPGNTSGVYPDNLGISPGSSPPGTINIGGNTIDAGNVAGLTGAMAEQLVSLNDNIGKLVSRLAPRKVMEPFRFNGFAYGQAPKLITMGGVKFNGFIYTIVQGTVYVYFGGEIDTTAAGVPLEPPDLVFVGGVSSGYQPLPSDVDLTLTIFSMDSANPLVGTLTATQY